MVNVFSRKMSSSRKRLKPTADDNLSASSATLNYVCRPIIHFEESTCDQFTLLADVKGRVLRF